MGNFSALVTDPSPDCLQRLVVWKDARVSDELTRNDEDGERGEGCADGGGEGEMEGSDEVVDVEGGERKGKTESDEEQKDGGNLWSATVGT